MDAKTPRTPRGNAKSGRGMNAETQRRGEKQREFSFKEDRFERLSAF
jgi:hypothetical protein